MATDGWVLNPKVNLSLTQKAHVELFEQWLEKPGLCGKEQLKGLVDHWRQPESGGLLYTVMCEGQIDGGISIFGRYLNVIWVKTQGQGIGCSVTYHALKKIYTDTGENPYVNAPNSKMKRVLSKIADWMPVLEELSGFREFDWQEDEHGGVYAGYVEIMNIIEPMAS